MCSVSPCKKTGPVTAIVIGAGMRGYAHGYYAKLSPDRLKIVGVVEPRKFYRELLQKEHGIHAEAAFADLPELLQRDRFADCVFVCTPDKLHKDAAVACAKKGYHILLEKPMAVTVEDCREIVSTCCEENVMLSVCHVLRCLPIARKVRQLIDSGAIGEVVNIQHMENIAYWHFAHSYVRGNWRNTASSTFSLLAKSCHDLDLISYWLEGQKCISVSSFGGLQHFTKKNKPADAADRCLDCPVEKSCPYSCTKLYFDPLCGMVYALTEEPDIESITEALRVGPYGRCVYECDNDVSDHQVVNLQFESGATVSFSMVAFTEEIGALTTTVQGTKGELVCDFRSNNVRLFRFLDDDFIMYDLNKEKEEKEGQPMLYGHAGADFCILDSFVDAVLQSDSSKIMTGPEESLAGHLLCFAAEKSRLENRVVHPQQENLA